MRIIVFGAVGSVGSRIVTEALVRGHEVTGVVRSAARLSDLPIGARGRVGNAADADEVAALSAGQDLVVSATRPPTGREQELVTAAEALLAGTAKNGVRLLLVGGAARLKLPDSEALLVEDPQYVPPSVHDIAVACRRQYEACLADRNADWTYLSPPAILAGGARTGRYRLGDDVLLFDGEGRPMISIEDFAVAVLDEAESPRHRRSAFTVVGDPYTLREREVEVRTPDGVVDGYFVHPSGGRYPGVLVWPDALGLRPALRDMAKRLAQAGYSVLVVNPHYRTMAAPIPVDANGFQQPEEREQVMKMARAITADMTRIDTCALTAFLDAQDSVDSSRKLAVVGYCMGGAMALRSAAASADRIGAFASLHGARLASTEPDSPHRLIGATIASGLICIAEADDEKEPGAKKVLQDTFDSVGRHAKIEVYAGTQHGWCMPDLPNHDPLQAERAGAALQLFLRKALA